MNRSSTTIVINSLEMCHLAWFFLSIFGDMKFKKAQL